MFQKRSPLTFLLFLMLMLSPFAFQANHIVVAAAYPPLLSVSHAPTLVQHQTNVTITVAFSDDTNVSSILIQYCALEPEFLCHFPKTSMIRVSANTWQGSFIVLEETGKIGYELHITYNGVLYLAPNASDFLGYSNIVEPSPDVFYFSISLSEETKTTPLRANPFSIGLVFLAIIIYRRKRK